MTGKLPFWLHTARACCQSCASSQQSRLPVPWLYTLDKRVYRQAPRIHSYRRFLLRTLYTTCPRLRRKQKILESGSSQDIEDTDVPAQNDANDFSAYHQAIAAAHEQLRSELSRVKVGGTARDLEAIEKIRVRLNKTGNGAGDGVTITDIASVVPRGKSVHVMVGEKDVSAICSPPDQHTLKAENSARSFQYMLIYVLCLLARQTCPLGSTTTA